MAETAKSTVQRKISINRDYDQNLEKANKENEVLQRYYIIWFKKKIILNFLNFFKGHFVNTNKQCMNNKEILKYNKSKIQWSEIHTDKL